MYRPIEGNACLFCKKVGRSGFYLHALMGSKLSIFSHFVQFLWCDRWYFIIDCSNYWLFRPARSIRGVIATLLSALKEENTAAWSRSFASRSEKDSILGGVNLYQSRTQRHTIVLLQTKALKITRIILYVLWTCTFFSVARWNFHIVNLVKIMSVQKFQVFGVDTLDCISNCWEHFLFFRSQSIFLLF
jgi:hypothetical protein